MNNTYRFSRIAFMTVVGAALAFPVAAQNAPATSGGPIAQNPAPGAGPGPGPGGGRGRGMRFSQDNTPGWQMMTPGEQAAHREKMMSAKTYEECKAFQVEHRALMEQRAKEAGKTLPVPRQNGCDRMKSGGYFK